MNSGTPRNSKSNHSSQSSNVTHLSQERIAAKQAVNDKVQKEQRIKEGFAQFLNAGEQQSRQQKRAQQRKKNKKKKK